MLYEGIVVVGGLFSFIAAMGIGANDVANAYATAVGSKALTIKQAVVLASVFETGGAIFMGSHVSKTIRKGIADYECFEDDPGPLMYGCMSVCLAVGLWLFIASKYEMPVSTTHSCVGGMIGMTMVLKGAGCVVWYEEKELFPYVGGVAGIVLSWVISPVFSAVISSTLYGIIRQVIMRSHHSFTRAKYLFPVLVGGTVSLNAFFIIYKGAKGLDLDETPLNVACAWAFGIGGASGLAIVPFLPAISEKAENAINNKNNNKITVEEQENNNINVQPEIVSDDNNNNDSICNTLVNYVNDSLKFDIDNIIEEDEIVAKIHEEAEVFEPKTEEFFKSIQVFTAICDSFSHGANDVANAIGPFMAIYIISKEGTVTKDNDFGSDAYWFLALGGVGISIGLFVYGYKILHAIGTKLCKLTPSRGSAIELASAIVIITGSRLEIPLSTTHCQVGATMGVAALEDPYTCKGINMKIIFKCVAGWVITLVVVGGTTALITAQGAYTPEVGKDC
jgi:sodium-dependent phosphate transporter